MASTAVAQLTAVSFTDLGASPTQITCLGYGPAMIVIADAKPADGAAGHTLTMGAGPIIYDPADASSHTWAAAVDTRWPTAIAYNTVSSQTG